MKDGTGRTTDILGQVHYTAPKSWPISEEKRGELGDEKVRQVAVELSMTASAAPTSSDEATLKTTIATVLSVDPSTIRDFVVTSTGTARRLLRFLLLSVVGERRLASSYTWTVSFSIVVSLSALTDDSQRLLELLAWRSKIVQAVSAASTSALAKPCAGRQRWQSLARW